MQTRQQWIDQLLAHYEIGADSPEIERLREALTNVFDKVRNKRNDDYLQSRPGISTQVVPAAGSTSIMHILALTLIIPAVGPATSLSALTLLRAARFLTSAAATVAVREFTLRQWPDEEIINSPLMQNIDRRFRNFQFDGINSREAQLTAMIDAVDRTLPSPRYSRLQTLAQGAINGGLECAFALPGVGTVVGSWGGNLLARRLENPSATVAVARPVP